MAQRVFKAKNHLRASQCTHWVVFPSKKIQKISLKVAKIYGEIQSGTRLLKN